MQTDSPPRVAIPLALERCVAPASGSIRTLRGATMGTTWSVKFVGSLAAAQTARRAVLIVLDRVIAQMSAWEPGSDLSRFNRSARDEWQTLASEFAAVVARALAIAQETDGAYDPTTGGLVDLWGFGSEPPPFGLPPSPDDVARALADCGWRQLERDAGFRLRRTRRGRIDVNGIAKGFAVDLVMAALQQHGIHHALVEIGGELAGRGVKPDGSPWWTGVDRPSAGLAPDVPPPLLVALHNLAIATSGCERAYERGGRHYSHTIDPRTGMPIDNGMVSATVLHPSCMDADAYATALMVMGPDAGMAFATERTLAAALLFRADPGGPIRERLTPAMAAMLDD